MLIVFVVALFVLSSNADPAYRNFVQRSNIGFNPVSIIDDRVRSNRAISANFGQAERFLANKRTFQDRLQDSRLKEVEENETSKLQIAAEKAAVEWAEDSLSNDARMNEEIAASERREEIASLQELERATQNTKTQDQYIQRARTEQQGRQRQSQVLSRQAGPKIVYRPSQSVSSNSQSSSSSSSSQYSSGITIATQRAEQRAEEEAARQRAAQIAAENMAARQRQTQIEAEQLAARQRSEQQAAARQRAAQIAAEQAAARQRAAQIAEQQAAAEQRSAQIAEEEAAKKAAVRQRVEQEAAERQRAAQIAAEQAAARQRAAQIAAEQAAERLRAEQQAQQQAAAAETAARQRAEQQAAQQVAAAQAAARQKAAQEAAERQRATQIAAEQASLRQRAAQIEAQQQVAAAQAATRQRAEQQATQQQTIQAQYEIRQREISRQQAQSTTNVNTVTRSQSGPGIVELVLPGQRSNAVSQSSSTVNNYQTRPRFYQPTSSSATSQSLSAQRNSLGFYQPQFDQSRLVYQPTKSSASVSQSKASAGSRFVPLFDQTTSINQATSNSEASQSLDARDRSRPKIVVYESDTGVNLRSPIIEVVSPGQFGTVVEIIDPEKSQSFGQNFSQQNRIAENILYQGISVIDDFERLNRATS